MTAASITPAPVRRSLFVKATPEHAFEVFTSGFDRWWPKGHSVGASPQKTAVLEPMAGGRWYEVGEDGGETQWGEVMTWEPPVRVVLIWRIGADWKCDPDLHTEVEVRFTPEGEGVPPELVQPGAQGAQAVRIDLVDAAGSFGPVGHQPRVLQHLQMLGDGWAADRQALSQLTHRPRPRSQALEHLASRGIGDGGEGARYVSHDLP